MAVKELTCEQWVAEFDAHVALLDTMALSQMQTACDRARGKLDAVEARRLSSEIGPDGDDKRAAKIAGRGGKRSKTRARQAAKRAAAIKKNDSLADELESGGLTPDQVDAIADAAAVDPSAANYRDFIDRVRHGNADQARVAARKRKHQGTDTESQWSRQRRLRNVKRWKDFETGLSVLQVAGDDATLAELWNLISAGEKRLRDKDGGRDLSTLEHPRTFDQRLFDATVELFRGSSPIGSRPAIVIQVSASSGSARYPDGTPLSDEFVRSQLARSDLSVQIVDGLTSEPLWQGRKRRHSSDAQFLALVTRDHGCVLCGAEWLRCEAHHVLPWNSPAQGATDIDNMALLCPSCHHHVHDAKLTIVQVDGTWGTRPAHPHEVACRIPSSPGSDPSSLRNQHRGRHRQTRSPGPRDAKPTSSRSHVHDHGPTAPRHTNPQLRPRPGRPKARQNASAGGHGDLSSDSGSDSGSGSGSVGAS